MKKIIIPILLAVILILIAFIGYSVYYIQENPRIAPDNTYTGNLTANYTFPFKDGTVNLSVSVPASVYYGAAGTQSKTIPYIKISTLSYYADIINDPLQEEMYARILSQTEEVRLPQDLTDDEYLELLATFVQSIHYKTEEDYRYPVETVIDKFGDCDDKSMLLTGLLTRAGFDAVLLVFEEEKHAAVGIKTNDATAYPDTGGYSVIETTDYSYVTDKSFTFEDGTSLESTPVIVSVGTGSKPYTSGYQVEAIIACRDKAEEQISLLSSETESNTGKIESMEETVIGYETKLNAIAALMDEKISAYNAYVDSANTLTADQKKLNREYASYKITYDEYVQQWDLLTAEQTKLLEAAASVMDEYTAYRAEYDTLFEEYEAYFSEYSLTYKTYSSTVGEQNRYVAIYNLIITEPYNREYVYEMVLRAS